LSFVERRSATRVALPEPLPAMLGSLRARLVEISGSGARVEHEERVVVFSETTLSFTWRGERAALRVKVARSEIAGRRDNTLIYQSGLQFGDTTDAEREPLRSLIYWAMTGDDAATRIEDGATAWTRLQPADAGQAPAPQAVPPPSQPPPAIPPPQPQRASTPTPPVAPPPAGSKSATAASNPFMSMGEDEDEPRYIRCTLGDDGWKREYVDDAAHPEHGFTVPIEQRADVDGLMRSYEMADPDTRGMIRASLRSA
jgi:hypothetical protein